MYGDASLQSCHSGGWERGWWLQDHTWSHNKFENNLGYKSCERLLQNESSHKRRISNKSQCVMFSLTLDTLLDLLIRFWKLLGIYFLKIYLFYLMCMCICLTGMYAMNYTHSLPIENRRGLWVPRNWSKR